MAKKTYNGVTYDDSLDYSAAIQQATAAGKDASSLVAARNAKIADMYGGKEPTMYGSDKTYSQLSSSGNAAAINKAINTGTPQNQYAGTNYHQDAINYAKVGDWDGVLSALRQRDEKVMNTGQNHGNSSADIYQQLLNQYGQQTEKQGGFEFDARPEYYDEYQVQIDAALDRLLNRDAFSYNVGEDPMYQQYADTYTREGERAMADTMARAAARTGGLASTYAVAAGQQANQYYMQQLADKVPELRQLAYQMYLDDIDLQVQDLGLLQNASQDAYSRYQDTLANWRNDRDFAYGSYRDDIADTQWQTQFDYNAERDSLADQRYDTEWEYQLSRDEIADQRYNTEWAYQQQQDAAAAARAAAGSGGGGTSYGDEVTAVAAWLGLSEKEANALKNVGSPEYTRALQEILGSGGSSSGSTGSSSTGSTNRNNTSNEPELDMDSVLALGYGPISETRLAELVKSGAVEMYVEGGKTKFRKAASGGYTSIYNLAR